MASMEDCQADTLSAGGGEQEEKNVEVENQEREEREEKGATCIWQ